jgi:FixJ family two-component response regulator
MKDELINESSVIDSHTVVYVIDDEAAMRDAIRSLLHSAGLVVQTFSCAQDFFSVSRRDVTACLVLDVRLKGQSGFEVREKMTAQRIRIPVIFMTAYGDIKMSVRAMKSGASDFLAKPFRDQDMLDAVTAALARDQQRRYTEQAMASVLRCFESLTSREQKVMELVANGLMNKQIAAAMDLSEMTVKIYRGRAMKKMEARSLADFVLKANALRKGIRTMGQQ